MKASVIKPGLLVSLRTNVRGGVQYKRFTLEPEAVQDDGSKRERWETLKQIPDPEEFDRATVARGKARSLVAGVCCSSLFGLLCPSDKEAELSEAIAAARAIAAAHNAGAALSSVEVFVLVGRVAQDDAEAARAIAGEVRELLDMLAESVKAGDVAAIRENANKARAIGGMLSEEVAGKVGAAIAEARRVAREIVKRVEAGSESAADVVRGVQLQAIDAARFSFLDLDAGAVQLEAPAGRSVDLDAAPAIQAAPSPQFSLEV